MQLYNTSSLQPTHTNCYLRDTHDALILIQAIIDNIIPTVERRPHERERAELIKSGNVFIFDEQRSQIQRWTDGLPWSPSRILGQFLVYREKDPSHHLKKSRCYSSAGVSKQSFGKRPSYPYYGSGNVPQAGGNRYGYFDDGVALDPYSPQVGSTLPEQVLFSNCTNRESYKDDGLIKKTFSITYGASTLRIVSYYSITDVKRGRLVPPSQDPKFKEVTLDPEVSANRSDRPFGSSVMDQFIPGSYGTNKMGFLPLHHPAAAAPEIPGIYGGYGSIDAELAVASQQQQQKQQQHLQPLPTAYRGCITTPPPSGENSSNSPIRTPPNAHGYPISATSNSPSDELEAAMMHSPPNVYTKHPDLITPEESYHISPQQSQSQSHHTEDIDPLDDDEIDEIDPQEYEEYHHQPRSSRLVSRLPQLDFEDPEDELDDEEDDGDYVDPELLKPKRTSNVYRQRYDVSPQPDSNYCIKDEPSEVYNESDLDVYAQSDSANAYGMKNCQDESQPGVSLYDILKSNDQHEEPNHVPPLVMNEYSIQH